MREKSNNQIPENIKNKMDSLSNQWEKLEESISLSKNETIKVKKQAPAPPLEEKITEKLEEVKLIKSVTSHLSEADLMESPNHLNPSIEISSQDDNMPNGVKLITVSDFNEQVPSQDKEIELLSNDLFDWLVWIDHTLESQVVTVGDLEEIQQAIHKYNVSFNLNIIIL